MTIIKSHGDTKGVPVRNHRKEDMEEKDKTRLNVLAYASPSLYGDFAKYFYSSENSALNLVMQFPNFDLLNATQFIATNDVDIIIAEPNVDRFSITDFLSLRQKADRPMLLVGWLTRERIWNSFPAAG